MGFEGSKLLFDDFGTGMSWILWLSFGLAFIMGAVANKTNFCTMGAVSDHVNMGDTGRWRAWLFAIVVAIIGVIVLEKLSTFGINKDGFTALDTDAKPPYRGTAFRIGNYIIGGLLFGIGMTFGSGCGNKTLVRIGGGNIKSVFVLFIMGIFAYWMVVGFDGNSLAGIPPFNWINDLSISMFPGQDIGSIASATSATKELGLWDWISLAVAVLALVFVLVTGNIFNRPEKIITLVISAAVIAGIIMSFTSAAPTAIDMRLYVGGALAFLLLIYILRSKHFTGSFDNILGGLVVGLCVVGMWYVNGSAHVKAYDIDDGSFVENVTPANFYKEWKNEIYALKSVPKVAPKATPTPAPKAETPKAAPTETPKAETPAPAETKAAPAETPKAETPAPAETPKEAPAETPKAETPAPAETKATPETPKAAPKTEVKSASKVAATSTNSKPVEFIRPDWGNRNVGAQGMTFVSPSAWFWNMIIGPASGKKDNKGKPLSFSAFINVPVMLLFGIIVGSFFWALVTRSFRIEWFASFKDFFTHTIGAIMMGVGGVMALGCTIGQGVTGVSTLALGSFVVLGSIFIGAAVTMKVQLYKMVYEDAGFGTILATAMADMKLLPKSMKKLESV